ncbi:ankyrin repeat, SAM and basic leucine zipper domain-containing protein 1 [Sitophilus oryzae]|uniref:Ankyrin repeat, SAM and basic leucine zipper domain-containing protein 1 n=1 Tax=Sitophilus oryzae TaxID=7048 RepID=A0A6J2YVV0_SITOR|nr:ankyrin repeat, SAM and basic leucine zipper domain-containing protein 1 [Sitophilus oryzae]
MELGPDPDLSDSDDSFFDDYYVEKKHNYTSQRNVCPELSPEEKYALELEEFYRVISHGDNESSKKFILEKGFEVDTDLKDGWTPLLLSSCYGNVELVKFLLENGANVNQHRDFMTAVMLACSCPSYTSPFEKSLEVLNVLVDNGANVRAINRKRVNALMIAATTGNILAVEYLLPLSDRNSIDNQGWTALTWAVSNNQPEVVEYLLDEGFETDLRDIRGHTPLEIARDNGLNDIMKLFPKKDLDLGEEFLDYGKVSYEDQLEDLKTQIRPRFFNEVCKIMVASNNEYLLQLFHDKNVTLEQFLAFSDEELKKLGVVMPFQRLKIMEALYKFHKRPYHPKSMHLCLNNKKVTNLDVATQLISAVQQLTAMEGSVKFALKNLEGDLTDEDKEKILRSVETLKKTIEKYKKANEKLSKKIIEWDQMTEQPDFISKKLIKSRFPWKKLTFCLSVFSVYLYFKLKH